MHCKEEMHPVFYFLIDAGSRGTMLNLTGPTTSVDLIHNLIHGIIKHS